MNIVLIKSKAFAVRIVRLNQYLQQGKAEYVLSKQVLRSGTSIGANIREATQAVSRPEFIQKMSIVLKESVETEYWLELLCETNYLTQRAFQSIYADNKELTRLLTSIINSSKHTQN